MGLPILFIFGIVTLALLLTYYFKKVKSTLFFHLGLLSFAIYIFLLVYNAVLYKDKLGILLGTTKQENQIILEKSNSNNIKNTNDVKKLVKEKVLEVPLQSQLPELPRGCEVTSLAMLLQYEGVKVGKMELAKNIKKDTTPMTYQYERIHFGNPNVGFVGDMYSYNKPGYGVYNQPIEELANRYLPNQVVNLTGKDFSEIVNQIINDQPVWVITNTTFKELSESQFETWVTKQGEIKITYKEHSVVITGFDEKFIYFNDPLANQKNRQIPKDDFVKAWEQMGMQAIAIK
ncbi:C39 family peptidase (plasmid) [Metabacillus halosaccharovorans]|uniref:C39 family peptidase n=1 Tax=Metabacillus halosaccharovorans TaxID=930124 RepID=UPI001C1F3D98|nr:C39 family peptidase [Metabacillus halosaccharovorans]MBU7595797.1 hypothetical protein [Metabacillus halosaccharovorans]MCM3441493.1 C39 family peptidase [Metabacillus halosaccharovorans]